MVCFAFWFGEVKSLVIAYNVSNIVLSGQIIPLRLFPDTVREIIYLTPLQFLVDFPVSIATGNLPMHLWLPKMGLAICWCIVVSVIGRIIYRLINVGTIRTLPVSLIFLSGKLEFSAFVSFSVKSLTQV